MRNPLSDRIVEIKPSGIRKFFDIVSEMDDAISLGVGEPDFDTPWHIRDEGIYSLEKGRTFYTSNTGLKELRQEIAAYLQRTQGVTYDPMKEVIVTVGGSEAIDIALRAMINPGDEVLIPQPSYVSYEPCAILANAKPVIIELKEENEFRLTAQELRDAITDKTKVLILPFPNNPTGAIMEKKDLEEIAEVIREKWGLEKDGYILYLGRIVPEKGEQYLCEAYRKLRTEKKLVFAGGASDSAEYFEQLKAQAKDCENMIFTDFVQGREREELFSNAYLFVLPSDLEGMPLGLMEAMSYGNCVVASDIPECADVVEDHGVTFRRGDAEDLRRVLQELCDQPEKVRQYQARAADFICEKYPWDQITAQTLKLYARSSAEKA